MNGKAGEGVNPSEISMNELFARTRESSAGWVGHLKFFRSVTNAPFRIDADDIATGLKVFALATLDSFPEKMTPECEAEMWENSSRAEHLISLIEKETPNFMKAARDQLGTHTGKVPNPSVAGPGGLIRDKDIFNEASALSFVSTASINARQAMGAAGNAREGRAQRFLCGRFLIGGDAVDVYESIAGKGVIYDAMTEIGFKPEDVEELSGILTTRMGGQSSEEPGRYAKALIWPTDEGDIVITPVHAYAMHVELAARLKERFAKTHRIGSSFIVVGSGSPQNAGLINSDLGGRHRLLESLPPKVTSKIARSMFLTTKTGTIPFGAAGKSHPAIKSFRDVAGNLDWNNNAARERMDRDISRLVKLSLSPCLDVLEEVKGGGIHSKAISADLAEPFQTLFAKGYEALGDKRGVFLQTVADHVLSLPHGIPVDDALRRRVTLVAETVLAETFKG